MRLYVQNKQFHSKRWCLIAAWLFCANVFAEDFFLQDFESYGINESDFDQMQIVPTHMMETETLFRAAEEERKSSMNMSQRLINNRWLLDESKYSYTGGEALRRYLRMYFVQNWKGNFDKKADKNNATLPVVKKQEMSQFKDISNYRLKVSDDKIRVRFKYEFD